MTTFGIYQGTPDGLVRFGTFTYRGRNRSLRDAARLFHEKHPRAAEGGPLFISTRRRLNGQWADDAERLPMDPPTQA